MSVSHSDQQRKKMCPSKVNIIIFIYVGRYIYGNQELLQHEPCLTHVEGF